MNTAQVSIELVLAGILALCAFVLPFWRGTEISQDLLQTDALIGILGLAYLLGVIFDKLADSILSPMEDYLRLQQAGKILAESKNKKSKPKDAFPQNTLEFQLRSATDGRLDWMNALKSRIRTSREVAVLGLPASLGFAVYEGFTKDCVAASSRVCSASWIYIPVLLNLLFLGAAIWRDLKTPDEESTTTRPTTVEAPPLLAQEMKELTALNPGRIKTHHLKHDPKERAHQMLQARRQVYADSMVYYLMLINSVIAIAIVSILRPENSWIAIFGLGGLLISLLSLWTCLRITRTYMKFIARASAQRSEDKSK